MMDEQEKQAKVKHLEDMLRGVRIGADIAGNMPEAGGICFTTLYSRTGTPYNITARHLTAWEALQEMVYTVQLAGLTLEMSTTKPAPPDAAPPHIPADQRIAREEGNAPMAAELKASADAIPPSRKGANVPYQTIVASVVKVLPQPDGKTTIEFYGDGRKYPDVKVNKWKVEAAQGLMKHVTAEPMDKAGEYKLECVVYYTDGNSYTKPDGTSGNYKDVEHVRPLPF